MKVLCFIQVQGAINVTVLEKLRFGCVIMMLLGKYVNNKLRKKNQKQILFIV